MIAIDNSALISETDGLGISPVDIALLAQGASFAYDPMAKTMTVTDTSVVTSPDTFSNANVEVSDTEGGTVIGNINASGGDTGALDVSSLALETPLTVKICITTTKGVQADGEANWINGTNDAGDIGYWVKNFSTNVGD